MSFPEVQPLRQVSLRYPCRSVPGFKILLKSYLPFLKLEIRDSPGVPLRKTDFLVYVQNDAKNDMLTQQKCGARDAVHISSAVRQSMPSSLTTPKQELEVHALGRS